MDNAEESVKRIKVLIVEDDESIQKLYDKGLPDHTFDKQFSKSGVDALHKYESWKPDIIILDIYLPEMTGYSVLKKIRKEWEDTNITIIISSSLQHDEHIKDCMNLGIQGYIVKPFRYKTIATEVIKCCQAGEKGMTDSGTAIKHMAAGYYAK